MNASKRLVGIGVVALVALVGVLSPAATALASPGQLYALAYNWSGQLGTATNSGSSYPNPAPALINTKSP